MAKSSGSIASSACAAGLSFSSAMTEPCGLVMRMVF